MRKPAILKDLKISRGGGDTLLSLLSAQVDARVNMFACIITTVRTLVWERTFLQCYHKSMVQNGSLISTCF